MAEKQNPVKKAYKIDVNKSITNKEYGLTTKAYNWWWVRHNSLSKKIFFYNFL